MKYFDEKTGKEVTFRDCEGGRSVVDENGNGAYLFYKPAEEVNLEEFFRSMPVIDKQAIGAAFVGQVGEIMNIEFVRN